MARMIMGLPMGDRRQVDHENRNKLDNRRENLRVVTDGQNKQNLDGRGGTSRHRGVSWSDQMGGWRADVKLDRRKVYLGTFSTEDEAAAVAAAYRAVNMPFSEDAAQAGGVKAARRSSIVGNGSSTLPPPPKRRPRCSDEVVARVLELYAAGGVTQAELGIRFGVSDATVCRWIKGLRRTGARC